MALCGSLVVANALGYTSSFSGTSAEIRCSSAGMRTNSSAGMSAGISASPSTAMGAAISASGASGSMSGNISGGGVSTRVSAGACVRVRVREKSNARCFAGGTHRADSRVAVTLPLRPGAIFRADRRAGLLVRAATEEGRGPGSVGKGTGRGRGRGKGKGK
ncbi:hypothetical protein CLOP_g8213 [Closterium sp. NIES-67]|nr:hypothetical protein CLOP_g8213 [Closterium sp. NIES-67]